MATLKDVINRFKKIKQIDLVEVIDISHQAILQFAKNQFVSSGAYGGKPWAFYGGEPKYAAYKQALGAELMPLRWTASMQRVYPALTNPNHSDHKWLKTNNSVKLDITIPYLARIEQGGTNQFGETFPAREIFPTDNRRLTEDVLAKVKQEFYRKTDEVMK